MPNPPPAVPGDALGSIDTPALIVDLDAFERNLATMAAAVRGSGVRLRPHAKSHKCPEIAQRQIAIGAVGSAPTESFAAMTDNQPSPHPHPLSRCRGRGGAS